MVVFRTADAVLVIDHFEAYRDGVGFRVNLQVREPSDRIDDLFFYESYSWSRPGEPPDDFLRLGVVFSDGSTWSNIDSPPAGEARSQVRHSSSWTAGAVTTAGR